MSPAHLRRFFVKPFAEIVHGMKKLGVPVMMHNDGNLWEVMDDLVASGINGFHPVERAATMDLAKIKSRYGSKLCPIGNINNKTTMVSGTTGGREAGGPRVPSDRRARGRLRAGHRPQPA